MFELPHCINGINCGDLGTWLSSIASFAAVVAALYLARRSDKPRARGTLSIVMFTPDVYRRLFCYQVTNLGTHALRVNSAFLEVHPMVRRLIKWPSAIAHNWRHPMNSGLPADLQRGESFIYATDIEDRPFAEFLADFPAPPGLIVRLIRVGVTTPWGPIYAKIDKDVRQTLRTQIAEHRSENKGD